MIITQVSQIARLLPESPRWLLLKGRYKEAEATLARIAAVNRRQVPPSEVLLPALKHISRQVSIILFTFCTIKAYP